MRKFTLLFFLLLLSIAGTQAQTVAEAYNPLTLEHDGLERVAHVYQPEGEINAVMIALHGFFSSARALEAVSGLNTIAGERGWVIVYPEATEPYWDDGRTENGIPPVYSSVDDSGYLSQLSDTVRETYNVDTVYLTGLGNGGTMAIRAVCDTPGQYDGVAIVNALPWTYQLENCDQEGSSFATDMIFINGASDHIYWLEGRTLTQVDATFSSAEATIQFFSTRSGCEDYSNYDIELSYLVTANNCNDGTRFAFLPVARSGNNWSNIPGSNLNQSGVDTAGLIAAFLTGEDNWELSTAASREVQEVPRAYALYVPPTYDPSTPAPLVVSLHGRGANNFSQAVSSDWNSLADKYGFIVVYPEAYNPTYNFPETEPSSWNYLYGTSIPGPHNEDDAVFLDNVIDELSLVLNVDSNRVYVNGLSNGGYMTHYLACARPERYAAFASMGANAPYGIQEICDFENGKHVPFMVYHGTSDIFSPWEGMRGQHPQTGEATYQLAPIPTTLNFWLEYNDCERTYEETRVDSNDPDSSVIYVNYTGCPEDAAVELYAVVGGGHLWHGIREIDSPLLGKSNMDVNASEAIRAFYSQFTLNGRDDSNAVEWNLPGSESVSGEGIVNIPLSYAELEIDLEANPQFRSVAALQRGGYAFFLATDLRETFDCDVTTDEEFLAYFENLADAFQRLGVRIGQVMTPEGCSATATVSEFFNATNDLIVYPEDRLANALSVRPLQGTITIVIGDAFELLAIGGGNIQPGEAVLFQPDGQSPNALITSPSSEWVDLADAYEAILNQD